MAQQGRPPKYETPQQMQDAIDAKRLEAQGKAGRPFKKEKDMADFFEANIERAFQSMFGVGVVEYKRELRLNKGNRFGARVPTVDFWVRTDSGDEWLVELKNPVNGYGELVAGVSQLLGYSVLAKKAWGGEYRLLYVVSRYVEVVGEMVRAFSLPVSLMVLNRSQHAYWSPEKQG